MFIENVKNLSTLHVSFGVVVYTDSMLLNDAEISNPSIQDIIKVREYTCELGAYRQL